MPTLSDRARQHTQNTHAKMIQRALTKSLAHDQISRGAGILLTSQAHTTILRGYADSASTRFSNSCS